MLRLSRFTNCLLSRKVAALKDVVVARLKAIGNDDVRTFWSRLVVVDDLNGESSICQHFLLDPIRRNNSLNASYHMSFPF